MRLSGSNRSPIQKGAQPPYKSTRASVRAETLMVTLRTLSTASTHCTIALVVRVWQALLCHLSSTHSLEGNNILDSAYITW